MEKDRVTRIEEALVAAHRSRPEVATDDLWPARVMAQVRARPIENRDPVLAQRLVWRFATVIGLLALACSVYAVSSGVGPEQLAMNVFLNDPLDLLAMRVFVL